MIHSRKQASYVLGVRAEEVAALYLERKGYRVLESRYKTPHGEIDLIVQKGEQVVFAEVKAHQDAEAALYAVNFRTRRRIEAAAQHYIAGHEDLVECAMRFDVLIVPPEMCEEGAPRLHNLLGDVSVQHLDNAWMVGE